MPMDSRIISGGKPRDFNTVMAKKAPQDCMLLDADQYEAIIKKTTP